MPPKAYTPVEMIERLVGFDTTSRDSNLKLIHFVADYLREHGVASTLIPNADGSKANLYATIGPRGLGGVVLSGHTDVVPVDGQEWHTDPFVVTRRGSRLYGRGTSDMKSFSAVALALLPEFLAARLKRPVHLALSYDEEVGCLGAPGIIEHFVKNGPRPELCIVGEPTEMQVVDAHKSIVAVDTTVTGFEAHSSATHMGVNAIMVAAELMGELARIGDDFKARKVPNAERFDPPYSTISVGMIQGGTARNIIPRQCVFRWDCRMLPGQDDNEVIERLRRFAERDVLPRLRKIHPGADIVIDKRHSVVPLRPDPGSPAEVLAHALAGSNSTHAASYATEAGLFQTAGVPTIICGPGNIREAHKPNEFIELEQVEACVGFMRRLMRRLAE
ncbi:MAG TPA: acetylornithine deacetylase [Candidatus Cybelea sp.]|nr:acetylornithine deacetylase [Candidatus Cybelea sp.]